MVYALKLNAVRTHACAYMPRLNWGITGLSAAKFFLSKTSYHDTTVTKSFPARCCANALSVSHSLPPLKAFGLDTHTHAHTHNVDNSLDKHCPLQTRRKIAPTRQVNRWLSDRAIEAKRARRRLERRWKSKGNNNTYAAYRRACRVANEKLIKARNE